MKRFFSTNALVLILLMLSANLSAQDKPLTFGVKAGVNLSNFTGKGAKGTDSRVGFNAGVTLDYQFTQELYLLTGLEFTMKGSQFELLSIEGEYSGKLKENPMYLQIPIHLGYKLAVTDATKIVFHAGPYIAYGIGGKTKLSNQEKFEYDGLEFNSSNLFGKDRYKRFDMGLGLGVGAEFGKICADLGFDYGFLNMSRHSDYKVRNMNAYLTLGYKF
ncbi:porin family protein [Prevotella sp. 10(H)]|uniref:porin family protein n=1 Tax=Prevotella sp. 10(H) TaxID=1158294 RepID=UPI0005697ECC|nr:porin family protein [Prevotella sp. 10(H)]